MSCWFGHTPHFGFSTKWKIKAYRVFNLFCIEGWEERRLHRQHTCKSCGLIYREIKRIDAATELALKEKPQPAEVKSE